MNQLLPGVRPDEFTAESDSEAEVAGEPASPASIHVQGELPEDSTDQDLSEDATGKLSEGTDLSLAGIRSLITTMHLPPWMITHLPVPEPNQPVKCLSGYRLMTGCVGNLRD